MEEHKTYQTIKPAAFKRAEAAPNDRLISINPLKLTIAAAFLILALAALFMFNARAVLINFSPGVDDVAVSGTFPTYKLGKRYLMLSGSYELSARLEGYESLSEAIEIGNESEQTLTFSMVPLPGIVEVKARFGNEEIEGAEVFVDQALVGTTPIVLEAVPAGTRDLYVKHPRFLAYQTEIEVIGKRERQTANILLAPAWASIKISSMPSAATISVDGVEVGSTPDSVEVIEGIRTLTLKRVGYKSWETEIDVKAQVDQEIDVIVLAKSDGKLTITSSPTGANITIAGRYRGQTPLSIALPPNDRYEMVATRAGYASLSRSIRIRAEEDQTINLPMKPITGQVRISVLPTGGQLYIDDELIGEPNQTLDLTARSHQIRVEQSGYASYETSIIPQPGFAQQLNIILQTEAEALAAAIPERVTTSLGNILRFIVPGELSMGAGRREPGRRSNEIEKSVKLTRAFYLGEKEVTNKLFKQFDPGHDAGVLGRALLSEPDRPVVNVSWDQAIRFCNWLSNQDGIEPAYELIDGLWSLVNPVNTGYRLPFESEWAWAARYSASNPSRFPWGNSMPPPSGAGNFADETAVNMVPYRIIGYNDNFRGPAPPGTFSPNELGVYDLAGNVSEWIHDFYAVELSRETLIDPTGPKAGDYHVIRGSNYTHGRFSELRWTFRDYGSNGRPDVGFRIARYLK